MAASFHPGEVEAQEKAFVRELAEALGRQSIRDFMPDQHRSFFAGLGFVVLGASDDNGQPWVTILCGRPGFIRTPDPRLLMIGADFHPFDPIFSKLRPGAAVALLGIEFHTRRRNRVNGSLSRIDGAGLHIFVEQAFGNCKKYIRQRSWTPVRGASREKASFLDEEAVAAIRAADTFFIATHAPSPGQGDCRYGADVSHRGGEPGFVRVLDSSTLSWPDFPGNFYFNTLGNLLLDPRAGLLFPDFAGGGLLYLAGRGEVIWNGEKGGDRTVRFRIEKMIRLRAR